MNNNEICQVFAAIVALHLIHEICYGQAQLIHCDSSPGPAWEGSQWLLAPTCGWAWRWDLVPLDGSRVSVTQSW